MDCPPMTALPNTKIEFHDSMVNGEGCTVALRKLEAAVEGEDQVDDEVG